jgi:hypothetical protein
MAAGTFSSIFVAVPLLAIWKEREQKWSTLRARIAARATEPTGARVRASSADADADGAAVGTRAAPGIRPPKRGRGKPRRRR